MSKQSGLGDNLYVNGLDVSGDIMQVNELGGGPTALEMTAINQEAFDRKGGLADGRANVTSYFDPDVGQAHEAYSTMNRSDNVVSYLRGVGIGKPVASIIGKQTNYDGSRPQDGSFNLAVSSVGNRYGLDWGIQLTNGFRDDTTDTDGVTYDGLASTAFGAQAFLHVADFDGTDVTINIQDSANNVDWLDVVDLEFAEITAFTNPFAERIQTARDATIRRYLRVSTSGDFTSVSFFVAVTKNLVEVKF